jgi:5,6-dimethylbenzimidazole synthase
VRTLWLVARAHGIRLGWVSILGPQQVCCTLEVSPHQQLVAYLCLGYPEKE